MVRGQISHPYKTASMLKITLLYILIFGSRNNAVGIATGYGLDGRGFKVRVPAVATFLSSPRRTDRFWGPPSVLSNGYRGIFPGGYNDRGVEVTSHLQLVTRSRIHGSIHPLPHTSSWRSARLVKHRDNFTLYSNL
jgi:hypothetical protein